MTALYRARVALYRALDCRSMMRADQLYSARDALAAAGFPRWADIAESAALRIGGSDGDLERLLFEIDRERSRREHSLPEVAQ